MKSVKYGSETFLTADAVADALLTFAASLRGMDHGTLITVPTVDDAGVSGSISLVIAPGIPILSRPSVSEIPDPDAIDLLRQIADVTRKRTTPSLVIPGETGPSNHVVIDASELDDEDGGI